MKDNLQALGRTLLLGLALILPLALLVFVLDETFTFLVGIVDPMVEWMPLEDEKELPVARILALALLLGTCLGLGYFARTAFGARSVGWIERRFLERVPGYKTLRSLTRNLTGTGEGAQFSAAVVEVGADALALAYLIEEHDNGYCTIISPSAPAASIGAVQYLPSSRVHKLDVPLIKIFNCINQYGLGGDVYLRPYVPAKQGSAEGPEPEQHDKEKNP